MILALEAKRLLHKGCEAYLAHVVDMSTPKVTLRSVPILQKFSDIFFKNLLGCHQIESWNSKLNCCRIQHPSLYHRIG